MAVSAGQLLWTPEDASTTRIHVFQDHIRHKYQVKIDSYESLRQWSLTNLNDFWEEVWHFTGIRALNSYQKAVDANCPIYPRPEFFKGARLNFAENLLYPLCNPDENSYAVLEATEASRQMFTWKELRVRVRQCSVALTRAGVTNGDCVAGYLGNRCSALIAMLASTAIGALWTAISPDTGIHAVLERMQQVNPTVLFADAAYSYNGKIYMMHQKLKDIVRQLPQLGSCVVFEADTARNVDLSDIRLAMGAAQSYDDFVRGIGSVPNFVFKQLPADHPVYILYSSGTTGKPKAIVHGAIGTLIQHKKEHDLQCDIRPGHRLFYYTTCTWMMWHWLVSALATGVTIVLYDGSPFHSAQPGDTGNMAMPKLIEELKITHFGTSAKYLTVLEQNDIMPRRLANLQHLKAIYSTGSPLATTTFGYVYRAFGNISLGSITGGTDIISLFGAPSPISPIHAGEIQVRGLAMAVEAWDYQGRNVTDTGEPGDLVCVKAFPSQPVSFWGPDGAEKYRKSYFDHFPGVWHHGDFVRLNPRTGGLIMLGRSDGVLKPAGVRFGSSEIYNIITKYFSEFEDGLCVGRRREQDADEAVILFVKMSKDAQFSPRLADKVKDVVRRELSARHVPTIVDQCPEIPVTINGKKVEIAVKQILCGIDVQTSVSVANLECLDWYREWNKDHPD